LSSTAEVLEARRDERCLVGLADTERERAQEIPRDDRGAVIRRDGDARDTAGRGGVQPEERARRVIARDEAGGRGGDGDLARQPGVEGRHDLAAHPVDGVDEAADHDVPVGVDAERVALDVDLPVAVVIGRVAAALQRTTARVTPWSVRRAR
jgi:hypothetical protein